MASGCRDIDFVHLPSFRETRRIIRQNNASDIQRADRIVEHGRMGSVDQAKKMVILLDQLLSEKWAERQNDIFFLTHMLHSYGRIYPRARIRRQWRPEVSLLLNHLEQRIHCLNPMQLTNMFHALASMQLFNCERFMDHSWFPAAMRGMATFNAIDLVKAVSASSILGIRNQLFMRQWFVSALPYIAMMDIDQLGKIAYALSRLNIYNLFGHTWCGVVFDREDEVSYDDYLLITGFEERWWQAVNDRLANASIDDCAAILWAEANRSPDAEWSPFMETVLSRLEEHDPMKASIRALQKLFPIHIHYPGRFNSDWCDGFWTLESYWRQLRPAPSSFDAAVARILDEISEEFDVSYAQQVLVAGFHVDFAVDIGDEVVIVECDGTRYHRTAERLRDRLIEKNNRVVHLSDLEFTAAQHKPSLVYCKLYGIDYWDLE